MEKLLFKFKLPLITNLSLVSHIVCEGFYKTGNKFSVNLNGSKGYLSNIEIACEGTQKERDNVIWVEMLKTKKGTLRNKTVEIYHSEEKGVRVSI